MISGTVGAASGTGGGAVGGDSTTGRCSTTGGGCTTCGGGFGGVAAGGRFAGVDSSGDTSQGMLSPSATVGGFGGGFGSALGGGVGADFPAVEGLAVEQLIEAVFVGFGGVFRPEDAG